MVTKHHQITSIRILVELFSGKDCKKNFFFSALKSVLEAYAIGALPFSKHAAKPCIYELTCTWAALSLSKNFRTGHSVIILHTF